MSACIAHEDLRRWLDGELPDDQASTVGCHVVECSRCQSALDEETESAGLRRWAASDALGRVAADDALLDGLLAPIRAMPTIREGAPTIGEMEATSGDVPAIPPGLAARSLGAFHLLEELGRGGMGIVHRAWDDTLHREVAIKILRPEMAEPAYRLRLVREAQFAAQFRHDHAVLVFSVVDPPDGLPYLVMEYVAGPSLAELLASPSRPELREFATWIAQIAGALEAAHAAGLIHRDVKPGNILIDRASGRAKIADFGLARAAGGEASVTHVGWAAGTPTYMSPEQAAGESTLDPRTDVYSLGATLYEGLTGIPPYQGEPHLVLRQIIEDDPRPLRQLNDRVPRDLETICLKAMERETARRYPTAAAMADELDRWLRGEPIRSRPVGRPERLYRWCRRKPWYAGLWGALLVVLVTGFAGVIWQWRRAERNALRAGMLRQEAEANLEESRASFQQARRAVDQFYARFYEEGILNTPGLEKTRHEVIAEMLRYYSEFVRRHHGDPTLRLELAEACQRLGLMTSEQGDLTDALVLLRRALSDYEQLSRDSTEDPAISDKVLVCLNNIGQLEEKLGDSTSARHTYGRGIEILQRLVREQPTVLAHKRRLAGIQGNLANLFFRAKDFPRARDAYRSALGYQEELVRSEPANLAFLNDLGMTYNNMAMVLEDPNDGLALLRKALEVRDQVVKRAPTTPYYRRNLARSYQNVGAALSLQNRQKDAEKSLQESLRLLEQVVIEQPSIQYYQANLADVLCSLGASLGSQGRHDEAKAAFLRARAIYLKLLRASPDDLQFKGALDFVQKNLAKAEAVMKSSRPTTADDLAKKPPASRP